MKTQATTKEIKNTKFVSNFIVLITFKNKVFVTGLHFKMHFTGRGFSYQHKLFVDRAQSIAKIVIQNPVVMELSN